MNNLLVKNGFVFDPLNLIDGEKMDVCVRDGKIVEKIDEKRAAYTIKSGEVVAKDGKIVKSIEGKTFWVNVGLSSSHSEVNSNLKQRFREYWTVEYENYPVPESYLAVSAPISVKAEV